MIPAMPPRYKKLMHPIDGKKYVLLMSAEYYSERFNRWVEVKSGMLSDGATGAMDLRGSWSWWYHDQLCNTGLWQCGTPCSAWEASMVLCDILDEEGRELRKFTWKWATFLFGSWKIKSEVGWLPQKDRYVNCEGSA